MKILYDDGKGSSDAYPTCFPLELRRSKLEMGDTILLEKRVKMETRDEKGSRRRRLIRAVKDVLFHFKLRKKRIGSETVVMRSNSSFSFRLCRKRNHRNETVLDLPKSASTRSTSSTALLSSSSPRTSVSSINQNPKPQKQSSIREQSILKDQGSLKEQSSVAKQGMRQRRCVSLMIGLVLILMSLALTILWGKVWAITFNAMWLACIPQKQGLRSSSSSSRRVDDVEGLKEMRRKVVIMEGLLDRRQHHHQTWQQQLKL